MLFTPLEFFKICMIDAGKQYDIQWQDVLVYIDIIDIYIQHIFYILWKNSSGMKAK